MSNYVKSNNVIIELLVDATYYPVFCGKTMEFSQNQDLIEVTSINSGAAREYEAGMTNCTLAISGVTILDNLDNRIAVLYLMQVSIRRTAQTMRIRLIDDDGTAKQIAFNAIITNNTITRAVGTYSQSSTALTITGEPVISDIIPPPGLACVEDPLYIDVVAGETSVYNVLLDDPAVVILAVSREGLGQTEASGTPGNREFYFPGGDGRVYFDPTNPFLAGEVIYVLYKLI